MKNSLIFIITFYLLAFGFSANAQVYNMTAGTINSCSGNFYDPGGSGANYGNNVNITETFCSNSSNCIIVTFTAFNTQAGNDILTIYDGPSTASPVIGTFSGNTSPGAIISSSGCITFRFVSNGSNTKPGWAATISCGSCGSSYLMNNTSVATCSGLFFDSGGSASNYGNNENFTKTFCSSAGSCLQIQFTAFNIKSGDNLIVYDGPTVASPQIGTYSGTTIPPTMLSSTGCLTVRFTSNGASNGAGWEAVVSCEQCPSTPAGTATYTQPVLGLQNTYVGTNMVSTCGGTFTDDGGVGGNYSNNINEVYRTFCPATAGNCLRATFWSFDVESVFDYLTIRNGPTQFSPQFGAGSTWYGTASTYQACLASGLGPYTSTDQSGCLTFAFNSDASIAQGGWVVTFDCLPCSNGPNGTDNSDCKSPTAVCGNQSITDASTGPGIISDGGGGCVLAENFSNWYKILISTSGTLGLTIAPNVTADDYDFALYSASACASLGTPVRCSYAANTGNTGMNNALNLSTNSLTCGLPNNGSDLSEDVCGNAWVNELPVLTGQSYYLLVNKWSPGGSGFTLNWNLTGGASLNCSVLPVELINFEATPIKDNVVIRWSTASETNNNFFTVERSSDGIKFEVIQILQGAGSSTIRNDYTTVDDSPYKGISYYRLKQIDFDGTISYSNIVPVKIDANNVFYIVPNPATEKAELIFGSSDNSQMQLKIFNMHGNQVAFENIDPVQGLNHHTLNLENLDKGIYYLILENKFTSLKTRLVKL